MLFVQRIKVTSAARKGGRVTFSDHVDMHRMQPLRESFDVDGDQHATAALADAALPMVFPVLSLRSACARFCAPALPLAINKNSIPANATIGNFLFNMTISLRKPFMANRFQNVYCSAA